MPNQLPGGGAPWDLGVGIERASGLSWCGSWCSRPTMRSKSKGKDSSPACSPPQLGSVPAAIAGRHWALRQQVILPASIVCNALISACEETRMTKMTLQFLHQMWLRCLQPDASPTTLSSAHPGKVASRCEPRCSFELQQLGLQLAVITYMALGSRICLRVSPWASATAERAADMGVFLSTFFSIWILNCLFPFHHWSYGSSSRHNPRHSN